MKRREGVNSCKFWFPAGREIAVKYTEKGVTSPHSKSCRMPVVLVYTAKWCDYSGCLLPCDFSSRVRFAYEGELRPIVLGSKSVV